MNMQKAGVAALALLLLTGSPLRAQSTEAKRALEGYAELRPSAEDLVMYRLDWAKSYSDAKKRAASEKRPLFVILIHARYGECYTGHC